jgi:type 1 glutamine amidotransferase
MQKNIAMSTTDRIPGPEGNREVQRSVMTWISGYLSLEDAHGAMVRWAESNGYDAVIGIRFAAHPDVDYGGGANYSGGPDSRLRWTMYGTAIGWQGPQH